jgi:hypothetical protein
MAYNGPLPQVVNAGGTGAASYTPYSVITAGTTSTAAMGNVTGVGTSGQVLTSNGAAALPTWQAAGSSSFAPNSTINLSDDFIGSSAVTTGNFASSLGWAGGLFTYNSADQSITHPGVIRNSAGAEAFLLLSSQGAFADSALILGGGAISVNWVIKTAILSTTSPRYSLYVGLVNSSAGTVAPTNGVYLSYSDNVNSGNWVGNCTSASSTTSANSSVAAQTSTFVNLGITVNAAANSAAFFINGTQISNSPITSNIPTTVLSPAFQMIANTGTPASASLLVDLFYMTYTLTTPR